MVKESHCMLLLHYTLEGAINNFCGMERMEMMTGTSSREKEEGRRNGGDRIHTNNL